MLFKYTAHEFNLSLTVQALEKLETDACSGPFIGEWEINLSEDIPLLQECAFIRYRQQIKDYMNKIEEEEMREFKKLKVIYL